MRDRRNVSLENVRGARLAAGPWLRLPGFGRVVLDAVGRRDDLDAPHRRRRAESRAEYATVDEWAESILEGVENCVHNLDRWDDRDPLGRIVVLAGRTYVEPLREGLDALAEEHGFEMVCPFDDTSGIGDQIGWLTERIETAEEQDTRVPAGTEVDTGDIEAESADTSENSGSAQADLAGFANRDSGA